MTTVGPIQGGERLFVALTKEVVVPVSNHTAVEGAAEISGGEARKPEADVGCHCADKNMIYAGASLLPGAGTCVVASPDCGAENALSQMTCSNCDEYLCSKHHWCLETNWLQQIRQCEICTFFFCRKCDEMDVCGACHIVNCADCSRMKRCQFCKNVFCSTPVQDAAGAGIDGSDLARAAAAGKKHCMNALIGCTGTCGGVLMCAPCSFKCTICGEVRCADCLESGDGGGAACARCQCPMCHSCAAACMCCQAALCRKDAAENTCSVGTCGIIFCKDACRKFVLRCIACDKPFCLRCFAEKGACTSCGLVFEERQYARLRERLDSVVSAGGNDASLEPKGDAEDAFRAYVGSALDAAARIKPPPQLLSAPARSMSVAAGPMTAAAAAATPSTVAPGPSAVEGGTPILEESGPVFQMGVSGPSAGISPRTPPLQKTSRFQAKAGVPASAPAAAANVSVTVPPAAAFGVSPDASAPPVSAAATLPLASQPSAKAPALTAVTPVAATPAAALQVLSVQPVAPRAAAPAQGTVAAAAKAPPREETAPLSAGVSAGVRSILRLSSNGVADAAQVARNGSNLNAVAAMKGPADLELGAKLRDVTGVPASSPALSAPAAAASMAAEVVVASAASAAALTKAPQAAAAAATAAAAAAAAESAEASNKKKKKKKNKKGPAHNGDEAAAAAAVPAPAQQPAVARQLPSPQVPAPQPQVAAAAAAADVPVPYMQLVDFIESVMLGKRETDLVEITSMFRVHIEESLVKCIHAGDFKETVATLGTLSNVEEVSGIRQRVNSAEEAATVAAAAAEANGGRKAGDGDGGGGFDGGGDYGYDGLYGSEGDDRGDDASAGGGCGGGGGGSVAGAVLGLGDPAETAMRAAVAENDPEGLEAFLEDTKGQPGYAYLRKQARKHLKRIRDKEEEERRARIDAARVQRAAEAAAYLDAVPAAAPSAAAVGAYAAAAPSVAAAAAHRQRSEELLRLEQQLHRGEHTGGTVTVVLACPQPMVGFVIGKRGATIKLVMARSGAHVELDQSGPREADKKVLIHGPPAAVEDAKRLVNDILA
ncbi:unnamed protein product, partial [Phaeothamnion confervicola]